MLIIVHTNSDTLTFLSYEEVVEKLKSPNISASDKEMIAQKASDLLTVSNMDHDKIEYYKNIFAYYIQPVVY